MNLLCLTTENKEALNQIYNTAVGDRTTLVQLCELIKNHLAVYDPFVTEVEIVFGKARNGDIPHSLASIDKASKFLGYKPTKAIDSGIKEATSWYWGNMNEI
jgi:UDP-N-acetylglucosamine 4-epimerase